MSKSPERWRVRELLKTQRAPQLLARWAAQVTDDLDLGQTEAWLCELFELVFEIREWPINKVRAQKESVESRAREIVKVAYQTEVGYRAFRSPETQRPAFSIVRWPDRKSYAGLGLLVLFCQVLETVVEIAEVAGDERLGEVLGIVQSVLETAVDNEGE